MFKGEKFAKEDTASKYRRKKREFLHFLKNNFGNETLYTIFDNFAPDYTTIIAGLIEGKSLYTSFSDFLLHFEIVTYPHLAVDAQIELATWRQERGESITSITSASSSCSASSALTRISTSSNSFKDSLIRNCVIWPSQRRKRMRPPYRRHGDMSQKSTRGCAYSIPWLKIITTTTIILLT